MFRVSQHPSSGVLKPVTAASGIGRNIGTATSLQRGQIGTLIWPRWEAAVWREAAVGGKQVWEESSCQREVAVWREAAVRGKQLLVGSSCWREVAVPIL